MVSTGFQTGKLPKKRTSVPLGRTLDRGLVAYVSAASAAGVSLLALAQPAEAKIVYTRVSKEIEPKKILRLDLNRDGMTDFTLSNYSSVTYFDFKNKLTIAASGGNGVLSSAAVLRSGVQVGPKGKFQVGPQRMVQISRFCSETTQGGTCRSGTAGPWKNITNGYLGLKFYIHGQVHYGWARLNVTVTAGGVYALLTGYAYESVANEPITTGKTKGNADETDASNAGDPVNSGNNNQDRTTLGLLANGAMGLDVWRKRGATEK